ncbi:MAG TPA: mechanosensitive ion channel [Coleofasciculaceae cyanobacterium]
MTIALWQIISMPPALSNLLPAGLYSAQVPPIPGVSPDVTPFLNGLVRGVIALLVGWLLAVLVASVVRHVLGRLDMGRQLSAWLSGRSATDTALVPIENWAGAIAFWTIMLFAILVFLDAVGLQAASAPLQRFLGEILGYAPRIFSALLLAGLAWLAATAVKLLLTRGLQRFSLDDRLAQQMGGSSPILLNETLGNVLYWLILLLFLPFVLDALALQGPLAPIQGVISQVLDALPLIFKAVLVGVIGWFIARLVRVVVTNFLGAAGVDRLGYRIGLSGVAGTQSLSWIAGTITYAVILIVTAISVLQELQIQAISEPAVAMLNEILQAIPYILRAVIILAIAYVIGRFVSTLVSSFLSGVGFNNVPLALGLPTSVGSKSPSDIAGIIALVGVMLFATIAAIDSLKVPELTALVAGLTAIAGQVLVGVVIFAIGLYLANLAYRVVAMPGSRQASLLAQVARIGIIVLSGAMALQQMGIAPDIVNLAFGLILGAVAVASAIAFGLGGRDVASEQLRQWIDSIKR